MGGGVIERSSEDDLMGGVVDERFSDEDFTGGGVGERSSEDDFRGGEVGGRSSPAGTMAMHPEQIIPKISPMTHMSISLW
jgi:hypothetical protein